MRSCDLLLAWLDGAMVDDGTAAEIGIFSEWVRRGEKLAVIGCCTDLRQIRRRSLAAHAGLNLFVAGAIQSAGVLVWSIDDAIASVKKFGELARFKTACAVVNSIRQSCVSHPANLPPQILLPM